MIRIFLTGDNHFGKRYSRYKGIEDRLMESRYESLERMVQKAEKESCDFFVVAGDLFDRTDKIPQKDIRRIVQILAAFNGTVLVLPGNHDYYTGEESVWKFFEKTVSDEGPNIVLLNSFEEYEYTVGDETVVVYPAFCQLKHSKENNLGWIRSASVRTEGVINIGIAHGSLAGLSPDLKNEYFLMTGDELKAIPVDAWLLGHTHIQYPADLCEDRDTPGYRIFNPGTHEQTDLSNNTEGCGFILTITKEGSVATVAARKYVSGKIRYYDLPVSVSPDSETALRDAIGKVVSGIVKEDAIVRLTLTGTVGKDEYASKGAIYRELLQDFLFYETDDKELSEEITIDRVREEYAETSFAAKLLEELTEDPAELQMAYRMLAECKDE